MEKKVGEAGLVVGAYVECPAENYEVADGMAVHMMSDHMEGVVVEFEDQQMKVAEGDDEDLEFQKDDCVEQPYREVEAGRHQALLKVVVVDEDKQKEEV